MINGLERLSGGFRNDPESVKQPRQAVLGCQPSRESFVNPQALV
jgi:hypothetical protein